MSSRCVSRERMCWSISSEAGTQTGNICQAEEKYLVLNVGRRVRLQPTGRLFERVAAEEGVQT
jgi:hypothetical protein